MFVLSFTPNMLWTVHPPPRSPFTRRLGLVLIAPNRLRLLTPLLKPLLPESHSLSRPTHTISRFVFHHTEHLLPCPPFKQIKVFSEPFRQRKYRILANQTWGHYYFIFLFVCFFCLWHSEPPMNLVDLLDPQNTHVCVGFYTTSTVKLCETVLWFSGQFSRVERLLKCKTEESMPVPCKHVHCHCEFSFRVLFFSMSEKNGLTA